MLAGYIYVPMEASQIHQPRGGSGLQGLNGSYLKISAQSMIDQVNSCSFAAHYNTLQEAAIPANKGDSQDWFRWQQVSSIIWYKKSIREVFPKLLLSERLHW